MKVTVERCTGGIVDGDYRIMAPSPFDGRLHEIARIWNCGDGLAEERARVMAAALERAGQPAKE